MASSINRYALATILSGSAVLLSSCQTTVAQNQASPPTASPSAKLAPVAKLAPASFAKGGLPRAMWVWDATVITKLQNQKDLFDFCAKKGISLIYLDMGDIFLARKREVGDPKHITAPLLGKFLAAAHGKKIQVEAVDGAPEFALEAKHAEALLHLRKALDYNKQAAPNEKLDGFQWDTEPYILTEFKESPESQRRVLKQYLDSAAQMRDAVKRGPSLRLGYAISSFFDSQERALDWNGTKKPPAFHLMDILNTLPSGYIAIMAYRDKALGSNGSIAITRGEVDYAAKNTPKVKIWIGQETKDVTGDPPSITFWQEGENALEHALGQIETAYKGQPVVAGLAIHPWSDYRVLKPGEPIVAAAPSTEPLAITAPKANGVVARTMEVEGTAKPDAGVKVAVAVRPEGDTWYPQGESPIAANGTWSVPCRFGNENTPAGRVFEVRAQLKKADGSVANEQIVSVKTQ